MVSRSAPVLVALAALLCGCRQAAWRSPGPGVPLARDKVLIVGSIQFIPEILQHDPRGNLRLHITGEMGGHWVAAFDRDGQSVRNTDVWPPYVGADVALIPISGTFFVEVPRNRPVYLRGVGGHTNMGPFIVDVGLKLDVRRGDQVVYIGHIIVNRVGEKTIRAEDRQDQAEAAAVRGGRKAVARARWAKRLLVPADPPAPIMALAAP